MSGGNRKVCHEQRGFVTSRTATPTLLPDAQGPLVLMRRVQVLQWDPRSQWVQAQWVPGFCISLLQRKRVQLVQRMLQVPLFAAGSRVPVPALAEGAVLAAGSSAPGPFQW